MQASKLSRRGVVAGSLAAGLVGAPFVRGANAAGTLTIGLWDHWVPGANDVTAAIIKEWADKEKVDVKVDPKIIGGIIVQLGSRMVDASVRTKLSAIQHAMKEVR